MEWHAWEPGGSTGHDRQLRSLLEDNPTYKWALIIAGSVVGFLLVLSLSLLIFFKCCRSQSAPVAPETQTGHARSKPDIENGKLSPPKPPSPQGFEPVPPWEQYGLPPPGIMLSTTVPTQFTPFTSNPRPPSAPPYDRLVLISSRVHQPMKVAAAVLPNVAVVVYDWKIFTLQELVLNIKKTIGPGSKVTSIAVVAPGNKPGCVALLEGCTTTAEKLSTGGGELGQFWRVLAGCVAANGVADGRRVDLIGCRVVESPQEGAALMKALWCLTSVPFAAADDALGGYQLATFLEEPQSGALSIISSTIKAIDIYFNRYTLLGIEPPSATPAGAGLLPPLPNAAYAPPMPAGVPPPTALTLAPGVAPLPPAPQAPAAPPPPKDIFARFTEAVTAQGTTAAAIFAQYDKDKSGWLSADELTAMVAAVVPGTTQLDVDHFRSMLDIDGNQQITQAEFLAALDSNHRATAAAKSGRDETALMHTLHDYLSDNDQIIRNYFQEADLNNSGTLDHTEIVGLVAQIPGLEKDEQKLIASYLYQADTTGKGLLTFDQLKNAIKNYGTPAAQAAVNAPRPVPAAPVPAAATPLPVAAAPVAPASVPTAASATPPSPAPMAPQVPAQALPPQPPAYPAGVPAQAVPQPAAGQAPQPAVPLAPAVAPYAQQAPAAPANPAPAVPAPPAQPPTALSMAAAQPQSAAGYAPQAGALQPVVAAPVASSSSSTAATAPPVPASSQQQPPVLQAGASAVPQPVGVASLSSGLGSSAPATSVPTPGSEPVPGGKLIPLGK